MNNLEKSVFKLKIIGIGFISLGLVFSSLALLLELLN